MLGRFLPWLSLISIPIPIPIPTPMESSLGAASDAGAPRLRGRPSVPSRPVPARRIVLLGPQRLHPTLVDAVEAIGVEGPIAAVTAGWEEREDEIDELRAHVGRRVVNLQLHRRAEQVFHEDAEFQKAYRERRAGLRDLQEVYRQRLHYQMRSLRELHRRRGRPELLDPERHDALAAVRALDEHHLARLDEFHAEFEGRWRPLDRPAVTAQRREVEAALGDCGAVALAGGNVAILANRLRLFDLPSMIGLRPVFAWSAGAMLCAERVVLFHDRPPQGAGNPEIFGRGLGLCAGVVPLPHAHRRLRLDDPVRVGIFARRFAPAACLALDDGAQMVFDGRQWTFPLGGVRRLEPDGAVVEVTSP